MADAMDDFDLFWKAYPRRVARLDALKAWTQMHPPIATVLATLAWQCQTWTDPQFIPYPASWLRAGRWMDEPDAVPVRADDYGHTPPCANRAECLQRVLREGRTRTA